MHHHPFKVTLISPVLNLTSMQSENMVTRSLVVSFFTISGSGMFEQWVSSRSLASYLGKVSIILIIVESPLTLLPWGSSPVLVPPLLSSSLISSALSSPSSSTSTSSSTTFFAFLWDCLHGSSGSSSELGSLLASDARCFRPLCLDWPLLLPDLLLVVCCAFPDLWEFCVALPAHGLDIWRWEWKYYTRIHALGYPKYPAIVWFDVCCDLSYKHQSVF